MIGADRIHRGSRPRILLAAEASSEAGLLLATEICRAHQSRRPNPQPSIPRAGIYGECGINASPPPRLLKEFVMQVLAGVVIVIGLLVSRMLAVLVNQQLWLRFLSDGPPDAARTEHSAEIYLPLQARRGLWPGLLLYLPLFWVGMLVGRIDRESLLFPVGMAIAMIGAVLGCGAIWSAMGSCFPNRTLAEARISLISQRLEDSSKPEPVTSFRHLWRASYLWELASVSSESALGSSAASLGRVQAFLDQYEGDLAGARAGSESSGKLAVAVDELSAGNAEGLAEWRRKFDGLKAERKRLLEEWPSGSPDVLPTLRVVQLKPAISLRGLKLDDVELSGLPVGRRGEGPIIVGSLADVPAVTATGWSKPWVSDLDVLVTATAGPHRLLLEDSAGRSLEHPIQVQESRTVCLISFDVYSDRFAVDVYSGS